MMTSTNQSVVAVYDDHDHEVTTTKLIRRSVLKDEKGKKKERIVIARKKLSTFHK